jgi:UDP-N-acetylglucosamine 3-dehydrogenase
MLRIGLFGLGRWGTNILNTLKGMKGIEVEAHDVTSPNLSLLRRGTNLDGVIVATPGSTHAEVALPFIKAGIPTYIEKPFTTSLKDARRLEKAARQSGGRASLVFAGHIHIYNPAYQVAKKQAVAAGRFRYLYFEGTNNGPFRDDMSALWDWASHDVYLAMDLMDGALPTQVRAWGIKTLRPATSLYDFSVINMTFPDGLTAISTTSWLLPVKQKKVTIVGEKDSIIFDEAQPQKVVVYKNMGPTVEGEHVIKREPTIRHPQYPNKPPLQAELEEFIRCIQEKKQPLTGLAEGVAVVRVLAAAEKSMALEGKIIKL